MRRNIFVCSECNRKRELKWYRFSDWSIRFALKKKEDVQVICKKCTVWSWN